MKRNFEGRCIETNDDQTQNASSSAQHLTSTSYTNQAFYPNRHPEIPLNFHLPRNPYNSPNRGVPPSQLTGARNQFDAAAVRGNISHSQQLFHQTSWNTRPTYSYANQQHYAAVNPAQTWTQLGQSQHHQNVPVYPSHTSTRQITIPQNIGYQYLNENPLTSGQHLASTSNPNQPSDPNLHPEIPFNYNLPRYPTNSPYPNQAVPPPKQTRASHQFDVPAVRGNVSYHHQFQHQSSWNTHPTHSYANQQHYVAVGRARILTQPHVNQHDNAQTNSEQNVLIDLSHFSTQIGIPLSCYHVGLPHSCNQQSNAENSVPSVMYHGVVPFHQNNYQQPFYPFQNSTNQMYSSQTYSAQQPETSIAAQPAQTPRTGTYSQHESQQQTPQLFRADLTSQLTGPNTSMHRFSPPQALQEQVADQSVGDKQNIDMREASVLGSSIVGVQGNVHQENVNHNYYNSPGRSPVNEKNKDAAIKKHQKEHMKNLPESVVLYDETLKPNQLPDVHPQMHEYEAYKGESPVEKEEFIPSTKQKSVPPVYQKPVSFDEIIALTSQKKFIALVGPPGSGKTTLSKQLAKLSQPNQSAKFLLKFMDLSYIQPLTCKQLFVDYLSPGLNKKTKENAFQWMVENQDKCVFVLDSYDQAVWSLKNTPVNAGYDTPLPIDQLVANLCCKKFFKDSLLIFTSRPHSILKIPSQLRPNVTIHVDDLSTEDMGKLYRALAGDRNDELWKMVSTKTPQLFSLCHNPLLLQLIVFALSHQSVNKAKALHTITEVFKVVLEHLRRSKHARGNLDITKLWEPLGKMAYKGMLEKTVIFTRDNLGNLDASIVQDVIIAFAKFEHYFSNPRLFDGDQRFYFSHQMLQEVFAAKYICEFMSDEEFCRIIPIVAKGGHWSMVRRFLCGLLLGVKDKKVVRSPSCKPASPSVQNTEKPENTQGIALQFAGPSRSMERFPPVLQQPAGMTPQLIDANSLIYRFIPRQEIHQPVAGMTSQHAGPSSSMYRFPQAVQQLAGITPQFVCSNYSMYGFSPTQTIHQHLADNSFESLYGGASAQKLDKVETFRKNLIEYMKTGVHHNDLIDLLTDLQECSDNEKDFLASHLPVNFHFSQTPISSSAAHALAEILPRLNRTVELLRLQQCNLNSDTLRVICGGISKMKHGMEELALTGNEFGNAGVEIVSGCLGKLGLRKLSLNGCGISAAGLEVLCGEIKNLDIPMKELYLSENKFGDSGVEIISASGCLRKVKKLYLQHCGISDDGKQILYRELERLGLPRSTVNFTSFT